MDDKPARAKIWKAERRRRGPLGAALSSATCCEEKIAIIGGPISPWAAGGSGMAGLCRRSGQAYGLAGSLPGLGEARPIRGFIATRRRRGPTHPPPRGGGQQGDADDALTAAIRAVLAQPVPMAKALARSGHGRADMPPSRISLRGCFG